MLKKLQRNVPVLYGLGFFHSFLIILPVIVPFFMSKGLSLAEIFYLQTVYAATIVLLEAPSGYFADLFGRRAALLVGSLFHGVGYSYLNLVDDFGGLILFEIGVGIAGSLLSGADLAILYDTQRALQAEESSAHSQGIAHLGFVKSIAEGCGALLGGVLALYSFDVMVLAQSIAAWICLLLTLMVVEPPYRNGTGAPVDMRIMSIVKHLTRSDPLLRQVFIAIPAYSLASMHTAWLVQPHWASQGFSLAVFGVLWCAQSLAVAIANRWGFTLERQWGAARALVVMCALPVIGLLGLAWLDGWIGIAFSSLVFFGRGLSQVILLNALNRRVPSEYRATANSLTSFMFRLGFIFSGPLVGYVADTLGLSMAFNLLALGTLGICGFVMVPLIQSVRALPRAST